MPLDSRSHNDFWFFSRRGSKRHCKVEIAGNEDLSVYDTQIGRPVSTLNSIIEKNS